MTIDDQKQQAKRYARIRRVKQLLKWMPRRANIERYPVLKWFSKAARARPYLWSFKTQQVSPALYAGAIIAFLPLMGIQIVVALAAAIFLRANLPIAVGLQAITNPITAGFIYLTTYRIGRSMMDFLHIGADLNPIIKGFNATLVGGVALGVVIGGILDLLYRFAAREATKHRHSVIRPRPQGKQEGTDSLPDENSKQPLPEPQTPNSR